MALIARLRQLLPKTNALAKGPRVAPPDAYVARPGSELLRCSEVNRTALQRIERSVVCSPAVFDTKIMPILIWTANHVQCLPASKAHHHKDEGGLLTHLLETAGWANQALSGTPIDDDIPGIDAKRRKTDWHAILTLRAVAHDLGKTVTNFRVSVHRDDIPGQPPLSKTDRVWAATEACLPEWLDCIGRTYFVYQWKASRPRDHEQYEEMFFEWVRRSVKLQVDADIYEACRDKHSPKGAIIASMVERADGQSSGHYLGGLGRQFPDQSSQIAQIMLSMVETGHWYIDRFTSPVHTDGTAVYLSCDQGIEELFESIKASGFVDVLKVPTKRLLREKLQSSGLAGLHTVNLQVHDDSPVQQHLVVAHDLGRQMLDAFDRITTELGNDYHPRKSGREASSRSAMPSTTPEAPPRANARNVQSSPLGEIDMTTGELLSKPASSAVPPIDERPPVTPDFFPTDATAVRQPAARPPMGDPLSSADDSALDQSLVTAGSDHQFSFSDVVDFIDTIDRYPFRLKKGQTPSKKAAVFTVESGLAVRRRFVTKFLRRQFPTSSISYEEFCAYLRLVPNLLAPAGHSDSDLLVLDLSFAMALYDGKHREMLKPPVRHQSTDSPANPSRKLSTSEIPSSVVTSVSAGLNLIASRPPTSLEDEVKVLLDRCLDAADVDGKPVRPFLTHCITLQADLSPGSPALMLETGGNCVIRSAVVNDYLDDARNQARGGLKVTHPFLIRELRKAGLLSKDMSGRASRKKDLLIDNGRYRLLASVLDQVVSSGGDPRRD